MLTRRAAIAGLAGAANFAAWPARAQGFPTRTITLVVPYPAGGPVDFVARLIAQEAGTSLGHSIVVDNRAGGSGIIGTVAVARAEPDGHTLVLGTNQTHATNQSLIKNCPYDAVKDFAPVAGIAEIPHVLVVRKDLPASTAAEFVAYAKEKPGVLNYGSTGNGSASHLAFELFKARAGIAIQHVPFRGSAPMAQELIAGRLDASIATLPTVIGQIDGGELKVLAVASGKRAERLPDVPTLAQAGTSGVEADAWFALFAPAKTPPAAIERLYKAISDALAKETSKAALAKQGMTLALRPPAEVAAALPAEVEKWAAVIKAANVTID
jgi:tripartite-type tricarboxylate transporter receptor subunit TctC